MRILLIRQKTSYVISQLGYGLGIVATILHKAGHEVRVLDNNSQYRHYSDRDLLRLIRTLQPDAVGFNIVMHNAYETYRLVEKLRSKFPHLILVSGGMHMRYCSEEALRHGIDVVVNRDGEKVVVPLFYHLAARDRSRFREGLESIPGISYLREDGSISTPETYPALPDLDEVPVVDYDLFNMEDFLKTRNEPNVVFFTGSRGCPFQCTFCSTDIQRKDRRMNSAEWMFRNVKYYHERYGIRYLGIGDNNFTLPRERAVEFCNKIIQSGLNKKVTFSCNTKVETPLDDELLALMKEAGFRKIYLGLERMVPYSLTKIRKQSPIDKVHKVLSSIQNSGIEIGIAMLMGFPFDTAELLKEELESFKGLERYTSNFIPGILAPVPGTMYYDNYPRTREWYLDPNFLSVQRAYFATVQELYDIMGQLKYNFFNLTDETRKEIERIYRDFKQGNYGKFFTNRSLFYSTMLRLDLFIAKISELIFHVSPSLEFYTFNKVRYLRYFFGSLFFGKDVSAA